MSIAVQIQTKTLTALVAATLSLAASAQSVNLTFDAPVPGTLADAAGNGTGFTTRLPGTGGLIPLNDPEIALNNGVLSINAAERYCAPPGSNPPNGSNIGVFEAPCVIWSGSPGHAFTVSTTLLNVNLPHLSNTAAIIVGTSASQHMRVQVGYNAGQFIHLLEDGVQNLQTSANPYSPGANVDLSLSIDSCGVCTATWHVHGTNNSGSLGPMTIPWLGTATTLYFGVTAFQQSLNPSYPAAPFVSTFDNFVFTDLGGALGNAPLGPNGPNTIVWPVSSGGNGHAYEPVAVPCGIDWYAAHEAALAAGGHLASITSGPENDFVFALANSPAYWQVGSILGPWIGAFKPQSPGTPPGWRWVTSEPFTNFIVGGCGPPNNNCNTSPPQAEEYACYCHGPAPVTGFPISVPPGWNDLPAFGCGPGNLPVAYVVEYDTSLPCAVPTNTAFTLCAAHNAAGDARLQIFNLPTDTLYGKTLISTAAATPLGSGAFFGLNADLFTLTVLLAPPQIGDPLSWWSTEPGLFPDAPYLFPPGLMLPFAGMTWDLVAVAVTTSGTIHFSNFVQNTW